MQEKDSAGLQAKIASMRVKDPSESDSTPGVVDVTERKEKMMFS